MKFFKGMANFHTVKLIYKTVSKYHKNFALLHCVSSYPTPIEDINLNVINLYKQTFPDIVIGYSGHELGTDVCLVAVGMGAKVGRYMKYFRGLLIFIEYNYVFTTIYMFTDYRKTHYTK